jgi:predicted GNAT superfamily acetyltransferase
MTSEIVIRRAETIADYRACQEAQRLAWGITEENYVVPVATMVGAQHHGGLVLGAFLPDGTAVGVSFSFPGRTEGRLCLYSQLTGVIPGYQDRKIGRRLKMTQREIAKEEGIPCIAWAFDPLQAGNAHFNLETLGVKVGRYIENMYGPRSDALNRNSPTDRLIAVWETVPEPGLARDEIKAVDRLPALIATADGVVFSGMPRGSLVSLEIPSDIKTMRADSPELAERWGTAVRQAFLAAFAAGYRGVGFARENGRCHYVLEQGADDSRANGSDIHSE